MKKTNKGLAAAIVAAFLPLSAATAAPIAQAVVGPDAVSTYALAATPVEETQDNQISTVTVVRSASPAPVKPTTVTKSVIPDTVVPNAVVPVNLDTATTQYDLVLPQQPVKMTADSVFARSTDGYIQGRGNVDISQGTDEIHTDYVEGSTKSQIYNIPGKAVWIQGQNAMTGSGLIYNGKTKGATMDTMEGYISPTTYVRGTDGEMYDGKGYLKKGLITTPHAVAETPDYYITGDDIHIYPGDKYTAENTKLWFKHVCLLTYGHYEGRLDANAHKSYLFSLFPRPSYTKDDGLGLYGDAEFPMNRDGSFAFKVGYEIHTKSGFKPTAEFVRYSRYGNFSFGYSTEESTLNDKHVWARKFPEFKYTMPRIDFGTTGIYMNNNFSWGRWNEDYAGTGSHKGYQTEISHTPINLWHGSNIRFFAGYRKDMYSIKESMRRDPYNGVVFHQILSPRLWTNLWYYKHNLSGSTPYNFDTIDNPRQKGVSVGYAATPRDTFILTLVRDLDTHEISDRNYTWIRDLHSFMADITYKQVDKEWEVHVRAKDF